MKNAIQTRYAGCHFRSRLEARYALLFDALNLKWEYEVEGFELGEKEGRYLPDFKLEALGKYGPWVEIKGGSPTTIEIQKMSRLCEETCKYGFILCGSPSAAYALTGGFHKEGGFSPFSLASFHDFLDTVNVNHADWAAAAVLATEARFEFGETPSRPFGKALGHG